MGATANNQNDLAPAPYRVGVFVSGYAAAFVASPSDVEYRGADSLLSAQASASLQRYNGTRDQSR